MLLRLFIAVLWYSAWKGLTSGLSFVMFNCVLSLSHVGQLWYLIVSIPVLCHLSHFEITYQELEGHSPWNLVCSIADIGPTNFVQIMRFS